MDDVVEALAGDDTSLPRMSVYNVMSDLVEAGLVRRADVVLVLVDHAAFQALKDLPLEGKRVIDTRGLLR